MQQTLTQAQLHIKFSMSMTIFTYLEVIGFPRMVLQDARQQHIIQDFGTWGAAKNKLVHLNL